MNLFKSFLIGTGICLGLVLLLASVEVIDWLLGEYASTAFLVLFNIAVFTWLVHDIRKTFDKGRD